MLSRDIFSSEHDMLRETARKFYPIARAFADARVPRIYGGSNEIMRELIARSLRPGGG